MNINKILCCLCLLLAQRAYAQMQSSTEEPRMRYGVFGDMQFNHHLADFQRLPDCPTCSPLYESGNGVGGSFGALVEYPFSNRLMLQLRGGYYIHSGTLTSSTTIPVFNPATGSAVSGTFEYTIESHLSSLAIEPLVRFRLFGEFSLLGGGQVGAVMSRSFHQVEKIASPDFGVFEDNRKRTRNEYSGDLQNASPLHAALVFGLTYTLPLNAAHTMILAPEVLYSIGLTPVVKDLDWKVNAFRAGVSIMYSPKQQEPLPLVPPSKAPPLQPIITETPKPIIEKPLEKSLLAASVSAAGLEADGREKAMVTIRIEEFISTAQMHPLLNYIFFDDNSADLASRYIHPLTEKEKKQRPEAFHGDNALATYYQVLNIIGKRMTEIPKSTLVLVGCHADVGAEKDNTTLSRSRAEAVRRYLMDNWAIEESRLRIEPRGLPEKQSGSSDPDGPPENRRVELHSEEPRLLAPIIVSDTIRLSNPPSIRFRPLVQADHGIAAWTLHITQDDRMLKEFSGTAAPPETIDWKIEEDRPLLSHLNHTLRYSLEVTDGVGQHEVSRTDSLPIEQITLQKKRAERRADREIDKYSLILFDYNTSTLNAANQRIIDFIKKRIKPDATVTITGYTDRVGETEYNYRLSEERARSTANALGRAPEQANGAGETILLYDNGLPEGRFYCRTVQILVETPIHQ